MSVVSLDQKTSTYLTTFCRQKDCQSFYELSHDVQQMLANEAVKRLKLNAGNLQVCYMVLVCYYLRNLTENSKRGPRALGLLVSRINDNHNLSYNIVIGNEYGGELAWRNQKFSLSLFPVSDDTLQEYKLEADNRIDMIIAIFQLFNDTFNRLITEITTTDDNPVYYDQYGLSPHIDWDRDEDDDNTVAAKKCINCIRTLMNQNDSTNPETVSECERLVKSDNCTSEYILKPVR